jgi:hypothetical protein
VSAHLVECFLGLDGREDEERLFEGTHTKVADAADRLCAHISAQPPLGPEQVERLLARVHARQREVGYDGAYRKWIARVTPSDPA